MPNVRDRPHLKKAIEFAQASEIADKHALDLHKPIWAVHAICTQPLSKKIHHAIIAVVSTYHTGVDSKMLTIAVMARRGTWPERVAANPSCNTKRKQLLERLPTYPDEASPVWHGGWECERHILDVKPSQEKQATQLMVTVKVDDKDLQMEVDTGASASVLSEQIYGRLWKHEDAPPLCPTLVILRTYTGKSWLNWGLSLSTYSIRNRDEYWVC